MSHLLALENICVSFGGLNVIEDVSIRVSAGERRAVIGPNGAGKTTLFNVITGVVRPTSGTVWFDGSDLTRRQVHTRTRRGISRTFQITNLFSSLTVHENLKLAAYGLTPQKFSMLGRATLSAQANQRIDAALQLSRLQGRLNAIVRELSYGEQRQLELAMALVSRPRILLLDEPAAGLSPSERSVLSDIIRTLPRDMPIVLIDHDMDLVLKLVDYITVLSNGRLLAEGTPQEIRENTEVRNVYFGKARQDA